jgi:hypothetical protein
LLLKNLEKHFSTSPVVKKKDRTLGIRLSEEDITQFSNFAAELGIPLAELVRRLMAAAREHFYENDAWPREIAVVKKPRDGADIQPATLTPPSGTHNVRGETRSLSPTPAYAEARTQTKRKPKVFS